MAVKMAVKAVETEAAKPRHLGPRHSPMQRLHLRHTTDVGYEESHLTKVLGKVQHTRVLCQASVAQLCRVHQILTCTPTYLYRVSLRKVE